MINEDDGKRAGMCMVGFYVAMNKRARPEGTAKDERDNDKKDGAKDERVLHQMGQQRWKWLMN